MAKLLNLTEEEKLQKRLAMTHTERFYLLLKLYKLGEMMKRAKIINE